MGNFRNHSDIKLVKAETRRTYFDTKNFESYYKTHFFLKVY